MLLRITALSLLFCASALAQLVPYSRLSTNQFWTSNQWVTLKNGVLLTNPSAIGPVDSTIGYRVAGAAVLGSFLRGDGTNFVPSTATAFTIAGVSNLQGIVQGTASTNLTSITGTANYLPKWSVTAPYLTPTSLLFDNGTALGIGNATPANRVHVSLDDATTIATTTLLRLEHSSSGVPGISFGGQLVWGLESSTTVNRDAGSINVGWTDPADASRSSAMFFRNVNSGSTLATKMALSAAGGLSVGDAIATMPNGIINAASGFRVGLNATLGQYLRGNGTNIVLSPWVASDFVSAWPMTNGGTGRAMTATNGAVVWTDADSMELTGVGAAGQVLTSQGAAMPTWTTLPAGLSTPIVVTNGGSGSTGFNTNGVVFYDGSILTNDASFTYDSTNHLLNIEGSQISQTMTNGIWLENPTAADSTNREQYSPTVTFSGSFWNGSASINPAWKLGAVPTTNLFGLSQANPFVISYGTSPSTAAWVPVFGVGTPNLGAFLKSTGNGYRVYGVGDWMTNDYEYTDLKHAQLTVGKNGTGTQRDLTFLVGQTVATMSGTSGLTTFLNTAETQSALTYAATPVFDFSGDGVKLITMTGNITSTTTGNRVAGRKVTIILDPNGSARTMAWNASWRIFGTALPTTLAIGKYLVVTLQATGTAEGDVMAVAVTQN